MSYIHSSLRPSARKNIRATFHLLVLTLGVTLAGCSNQMEPAKKALTEIEMTVASAGPDAQRYIPDQVKEVNDQLAGLRAKFEQKDYKSVVSGAPAVLAKAQALVAAKDAAVQEATAKEAAETAAREAAAAQELATDWQTLSDALPKQLAALDSRLGVLAKSSKLPGKLTKDALKSAQSDVAEAKNAWASATTAQTNGDVRNAVAAAQQAKEKADAAMTILGMTSS